MKYSGFSLRGDADGSGSGSGSLGAGRGTNGKCGETAGTGAAEPVRREGPEMISSC